MPDTFSVIQRSLFVALVVGITIVFVWLLRDLIMPLLWAVIFAVLLYPVFIRIKKRLRERGALAALVTIFLALLIVFIPLYIIGAQLAFEAITLYSSISDRNITVDSLSQYIPGLVEVITPLVNDPSQLVQQFASLLQGTSQWLATQALTLGGSAVNFFFKFVLMLYVLFFLLRDGTRLGEYLMKIIPLGNKKEAALFSRFSSATRAVIKGTVVVAIVQGALGTILFAIAGIPNAVLWGVAMALLALIPAIGPGLVWAPAGVVLLLSGNIIGGIVVIAGGVLVIGLADNILRPILIGKDTQMPDALVLLAVLGGIASFGIAGVIIGPVIAALFLSVWELFGTEFKKELATRG